MLEWWEQLIILAVVWLILSLIRKKWPGFWRRLHVKRLDIVVIPLFIGVCDLSTQVFKLSLFPYIIFLLAVMGILIIIGMVSQNGDLIYRTFFLYFWRLTDILILVIYIVLLGLRLFKYL